MATEQSPKNDFAFSHKAATTTRKVLVADRPVMLDASIAVQITMAFMAVLSVYTLFRVIERVME